jgi:hypothetical protein
MYLIPICLCPSVRRIGLIRGVVEKRVGRGSGRPFIRYEYYWEQLPTGAKMGGLNHTCPCIKMSHLYNTATVRR